MRHIGYDIGTTSTSAVVLCGESGRVLEALTLDTPPRLAQTHPYEKLQDPEAIAEMAVATLRGLIERHGPIASIGLTGQMHGIVYYDADGRSLGPLYSWQDARGEEPFSEGRSYTEELKQRAATLPDAQNLSPLATGYGSVTHFYNSQNSLLPQGAQGFCTIYDYVGMRLAGRKTALLHAGSAASFGLYHLQKAAFVAPALRAVGLNPALYPETTEEFALLGKFLGIPLSVGIGDNQASFLGTVRQMEDSVLVNVGTGQQVSALCHSSSASPPLEARPCLKGQFLLVGAPVCGGEAYAVLARFFAEAAKAFTGAAPGDIYTALNREALAHLQDAEPLRVNTQLRGTRQNGSLRGSIAGISPANFTPGGLAAGFLQGMANEVWQLLGQMELATPRRQLVASGNGVRRNPALQKVLQNTFGLTPKIPAHQEEAAFGAALFGMVSAGVCRLEEAQRRIRYMGEA